MASRIKPLVLLILDGWGHREEVSNNAIAQANTPVMDKLWQQYPHTLISGSGLDVGLPDGQMGNSEVGHVNLGSGRVVYQDFTRITKAIADGDFFTNPVLVDAVTATKPQNKAVHIMGLLSPGGVHSHEDHLLAMIKLAEQQGAGPIYVHAFLDGRDTPPRSAKASIEKIQAHFAASGSGKIASVIGRYYAMDRDKRWDRVQKAFDLLTLGEADYTAPSAIAALELAYQRDENDEFTKPPVGPIGFLVIGAVAAYLLFSALRALVLREIPCVGKGCAGQLYTLAEHSGQYWGNLFFVVWMVLALGYTMYVTIKIWTRG